MSTIPLSSQDRETDTTTPYHGAVSEPVEQSTITDSALDKHINSALEKHAPGLFTEDGDEAPTPKTERKSLDEYVSAGLDKHDAEIEEKEAFARSREARSEISHRYGSQGGNDKATLEIFLNVADRLKANPTATAMDLAESYARMSPHVLDNMPEKKVRPEAKIIDGKRYNGNVLDHIIEDAMESATTEKETFEATKEQRARLKQVWPDLSFDQAMNRLRNIDRRMIASPLDGAAELAAAFGMGWTPRQQAVEAERNVADSHIAAATQQLPLMQRRDVRERMANIIANDARFNNVTTEQAIGHAYQMATEQLGREHQVVRAGVQWAQDTHEGAMRQNPQFAEAVLNTLQNDRAFAKHVQGATDPTELYRQAWSWTAARKSGASVSRARRATPVKSSSGAVAPSSKRKGLDAHIERAMQGKF